MVYVVYDIWLEEKTYGVLWEHEEENEMVYYG